MDAQLPQRNRAPCRWPGCGPRRSRWVIRLWRADCAPPQAASSTRPVFVVWPRTCAPWPLQRGIWWRAGLESLSTPQFGGGRPAPIFDRPRHYLLGLRRSRPKSRRIPFRRVAAVTEGIRSFNHPTAFKRPFWMSILLAFPLQTGRRRQARRPIFPIHVDRGFPMSARFRTPVCPIERLAN